MKIHHKYAESGKQLNFLSRHLGRIFLQAFWPKFFLAVVCVSYFPAGIWVEIFLQAFGSGTPFFGVNLAVEKEGPISEGDTVFAPAS